MASIETMDDLFLDELRDLYDAEKQLTKALPKMAKASVSGTLRSAFEEHLTQTEGHVQRLEQIFELLGEKGSGKTCAAMKGLIKEGDEIAGDTENTAVRDAGIIVAAQKVEHYEISGYGSARNHAQLLGQSGGGGQDHRQIGRQDEGCRGHFPPQWLIINNKAKPRGHRTVSPLPTGVLSFEVACYLHYGLLVVLPLYSG